MAVSTTVSVFSDAYQQFKENHIIACGGIEKAISTAKELNPGKPVEVEKPESLEELGASYQRGRRHHHARQLHHRAMRSCEDQRWPCCTRKLCNVTLDTIAEFAETGVDYISVGVLTKHLKAMDSSMRF
ncbi:hypothetical protein OK016_05960 [Vibrio chagasii]|nr:hypothetical protein [Vibrio chagasii]